MAEKLIYCRKIEIMCYSYKNLSTRKFTYNEIYCIFA